MSLLNQLWQNYVMTDGIYFFLSQNAEIIIDYKFISALAIFVPYGKYTAHVKRANLPQIK